MSEEDIQKAVNDAKAYEAQDKKRKDGIDAKNEADSMVFQVEQAMNEAGDKLDANDKNEIQADLNALKDTIAKCGDDLTDQQINDLKSGKEKLMNSAQKLFAKVYEQQAQQNGGANGANPGAGANPGTGSSGAGSNGGSNPNDDVVDGDYREV